MPASLSLVWAATAPRSRNEFCTIDETRDLTKKMRSREARFESLFWEDYLLISESGGAVKHRRTLLESRRMLPKPKPVAERLAEMQKRPARGATAKRPRSGNENIELDRHTRLKVRAPRRPLLCKIIGSKFI